MKKHICFAGFGPEELASLRPSLAALGGTWECFFAPDAAGALEAMEALPFHVMLANLGAGGMRDAELLHKASVLYPRMLRFVLGDVGDRGLIVECMGAAHQFISRPWKPADLVSIVERSLALDSWLANDKLRSLVPRLGTLPGLPSSYFEIIKRAESPNSSVEAIAEVIARDPSLTARLLQMVNSPACGLAEKITNPGEAVSMLGVETVKSLVLCLQMYAQSSQVQASGLSLDQLWQHSFLVAKMASKVVLRCISSERMASEAYTAGLLHNIGQIVLATNLADEYARVIDYARKEKCPLPEAEAKMLEVTSNQMGAYLLGLWGMPLPLLESTAMHLSPAAATSLEFSVLTAVHVANVLASEDSGKSSGLRPPKLDAEYLGTLGLPKKSDAWRKFLSSGPAHEPVKQSREPSQARPEPPARASDPRKESKRKEKAPNEPKEAGRPANKLLVFLGVAAVVVLVLVLKRNASHLSHGSSAETPEEATGTPGSQTTEPNSWNGSKAVAEAPKEPLTGTAFDTIKLQGIIYSAANPVALINGKPLSKGDRINGVEVISIQRSNVVLSCNGTEKTIKLK